jgi:hypothetical protein
VQYLGSAGPKRALSGQKAKTDYASTASLFAQPRLEEKSVLQITTLIPSSLGDGLDMGYPSTSCLRLLMPSIALCMESFWIKVSSCKVIPCPTLLIRADLLNLDPSAELCLRAKAHPATTTLFPNYPSARAADGPKCDTSTHNGHGIWMARLKTCHQQANNDRRLNTKGDTAKSFVSTIPFRRRSCFAVVHLSPVVGVKKQSEEEDFRDPPFVHDLPDRTPGEILSVHS